MKVIMYFMCCVLVLGCSNNEETITDTHYDISELGNKPVAQVGQAVITRAQLDHALAFYSTNPMVNAEEGRIKLLNDMIEEQVMYNKAVKNGFDKSPEFINNQRKLLAYEYKKYLQNKVAETTKVTEVDLQIHYEKNIEAYTKPSMKRVAIFQQRNDLPKGKLSLKQVQDAVSYLKPEDGFGQYALESHHSKTSNRAGKLPWVSDNTEIAGIPSELFKEAEDLDIGEVSDAIKIDNAIYLVRLMAKKEQVKTPLNEVKTSLRTQLLAERKASLFETFLQQAKEGTKIEIIKENLGKPNAVNTSDDRIGPPGFPVN